MKNKHEMIGLVSNIFAVLILLAIIVIGLNYIGLYNLPSPIEKVLGTYKGTDSADGVNDDEVYDLIDDDIVKSEIIVSELSYENAHLILENVSVKKDYFHDIVVSRHFDKMVLTENISIERQNGFYQAVVLNSDKIPVKIIKELEDEVSVEIPGDGVVLVPKGDFEFSDECGFVLDADEFLASNPMLDEASFSQTVSENGTFISVVFDYTEYGTTYKQEYVVSLDYGVVTEVRTYEQENLIYEMKTVSLSNTH